MPRVTGLAIFALAALSCGSEKRVSLLEEIRNGGDIAAEWLSESEIRGDARPALTPPFPETIQVDIQLPPKASRPELNVSIAVRTPRPAPRARVAFRVRVLSPPLPVTVLEETLRVDRHNRWHDHRIDLVAWGGKSVTLSFETYPAVTDAPIPWGNRIRTIWGNPRIEMRGPLEPSSEHASMILIVVDTLRYDYLGVDGFQGAISPNLDWLALESIRFDRAYAPAPWTKPSVASLLTGLYPEQHGVRDQAKRILPEGTDTLADGAVTLAELFREHGYRTAAFVGNAWLAPIYGFGQGFDTYVVEHEDDVLLEKVRAWFASAPERPYFLYLHLIDAHGPYEAPERDYRLLRKSPSLGADRTLDAGVPRRPAHLDATPWADADEGTSLSAWKAKYAAAVRHLDRRLGDLVNELRRSGELDRSWLLFTADHGEEFLEHGSWEHGYELCNHQIHVPLWMRKPGAQGAGRRVAEVVSLVDVMPTVLSIASIPIPDQLQTRDRSRWLEGEAPTGSSREVAFSSATLDRPELQSLRTERYHLLWDPLTDTCELFDLYRDPDETRDLAELEPDLTRRLKGRLVEHLEELSAAGSLDSETVPVSETLRERLRALGYIP